MSNEPDQQESPPKLADINPYLSQGALSTVEAEVLGEYLRMSTNLEKLTSIVNTLAASQPEVLARISPLERKLGLVLTLFKASVWATYVAQETREDEAL